MYATEPVTTCPRVIRQPARSRSVPTLGADGNRHFRWLNGPVDRPGGLLRRPVTGTRAEHHAVRLARPPFHPRPAPSDT